MSALALLLFTGTLFGALYALGKAAAATGMAPPAILLWQVAGGALGLALLAAAKREARPPRSAAHLRYYLVSGLLGVSAPNMLIYFAVQTVEVGIVALATALSTLFTYTGALALRMERFVGLRLAGCVLGLVGVALLGAAQAGTARGGFGLAAALAAPMFLAAGNIYRTRAWPAGTPPMALATGMLWMQLPLVALGAWLGGGAPLPAAALPALGAIALFAPVIYAGAFTLQRIGGPVYVSQFGYVMTASGAMLGYLFFGERYGPQVWLAAALVLGGVLLVNRTASTSAPRRIAPGYSPAPPAARSACR